MNEIKPTFESVISAINQTHQIIKELAEENRKTETMIKEQSILINGIGDSNGFAAETLITNTLASTMTLNGWNFNDAATNVNKYIKSLNVKDQYDLILGNDELLAIIEIKYRVRSQNVIELKTKKIPNYKLLFPNETRHIVGVVAGISIESQAIISAKEYGIYAITLAGEHIKVENSEYTEIV
jgi:hypothetical protein